MGDGSRGVVAFLGMGSIVLEKLAIGAWSTVGAGTLVAKAVPPNAIMAGIAGRAIRTRPAGWQDEAI
jgi:acetyltransferase-like isoleucine patch superfamily enzyme